VTVMTLDEAFVLNPTVSLSKGTVAPFVDMAALQPFRRDVYAVSRKPYAGGMKFLDGDVLMARITPSLENGKTSIYRAALGETGAAFGSTEFIVIRGREGVSDSRFAYYLFTSNELREHAIASMNGSSGRQRVQHDSLASYEIDLPPIDEQRGIAAALGALDDKIESNRRAIFIASDLLDAIADRVSLELVSVPLSEIATVTRSTVDPARLGGEQVDHFSLPAFDDGVWPERVPASSIMSSKLVLDGSSILISRLNPRFNRTWWVVPEKGITALASTEFSCLSAETRSDLAALWLAVRDRLFREEITHRVTGTSGSHQRIRPDDLLSIEVPDTRKLSDDVKQQALDLLGLINNRRREVRRLAAIRDALLPELLSGRIRVPEASGVAS
jgi:type I restriction enzyme S subunit